MAVVGRLDNVDILIRDKRTMLDFYTGVMGLPLRYPTRPEDDWFAVQAGDVTIYFFPSNGERSRQASGVSAENPSGIESIAWEVDDLERAISELDPYVEWAAEPREWHHPNGTYYRMRSFFDPEGNKVWVTEPHPVAEP